MGVLGLEFPFRSPCERQSESETVNGVINLEWIDKRRDGLDSLNEYIKEHDRREAEITLRDDQMDVFEKMRLFLDQGGTEGYIKLPTGIGKTVIFVEFLEAFNQRTLIVVPTKLLVDQTGERIDRFASQVEYGKVYQHAKDFGKRATIITYSSLLNQVRKGAIDPNDFDLLILDEVHQSLTDTRIETVQKFEHAIKIGFTATPQYSGEKSVANMLFETEIYEMGVKEAAEMGLLSPFSVIIARTEIDLSGVKLAEDGDYDATELEKTINIESRNQAAVKLYREMFNGKKALVNALSVNHAQQISEMFKEAGVPAAMIYGGNTKPERDKILKNFSKGEIIVLCNVNVLTQGFDEPSAEVCLNLRPTLSRVRAEQRAGRVLRLDPENHKKFAFIVDFMDQNKKNISLTFADIVGEAVVFGPGRIDNVEIFGNGRNKNEEDCLEEIVEKAKQIKIEGLKVTVKASEVMRIIQEVKDQIYETTPEGWKTVGALERELNAGSFIIRNMIFPYRSIRPEWFKVFLDKSLGRAFEHFHPNLVKTIKRSLEERRAVGLAPDGWKTKSALGRSLHIDVRALEEVLTENKIKNPNYFKIFTNKMGRLFEYLHPDLVKIIKEEYRERLEINHAPAGWMVANSLLDDLQIGYIVFGKIVAPYRTTNSEWFKLFLDDRNWPQEFMHPELVKIVKGELAERQKNGHAPEGWMVANMLKAKLNTDTPAIIRSRLKKYRKNNPDQFRTFLNGQNRQAEYISPYLVSMISQEINCSREQIVNIEVPPDGWVTSSYLRKKENIGGKKIRDIANKFRNTNPELLGIYLEPKNNKPIEYFSPELVEAMRQPLKRKPKK